VLDKVWDCPEPLPDGSAMDKIDPPPQVKLFPPQSTQCLCENTFSETEVMTMGKRDIEEKEETLEQSRSKEASKHSWREEIPKQGQGKETPN